MDFAGYNPLAVVAAAVASFLFGGLWYGVLSRQWMEAANMTPEQIKPTGSAGNLAPYVIAFVAQLLMAWILAGVIGHLGKGQVNTHNGIVSAVMMWLGFVVTSLAVNHAFQMQKKSLTLIDGGHWLGVLLIQGAIIGWMGVTPAG